MGTKIYGASDDLIEFAGDLNGGINNYETDNAESKYRGTLIILSDNSLLQIRYGKGHWGIWEIKMLQKGSLFERIEECTDEESKIYSDIAYFYDGLKWGIAATEWERIK